MSEDSNTRRAAQFYLQALRDGQPRQAAERYVGDGYRQHNLHVPDGIAAFIEHFEGFPERRPPCDIAVYRAFEDGDRVFLHRAGDVIPQVTGVAEAAAGRAPAGWADATPESLRTGDGLLPAVVAGWRETFAMPATCPACGTPALQEGKYWRCPNVYACEPQVIGRTLQMTHRSAFDVDGLGEKMVEQLFAAGYLRSPADLFHLDELREELALLERWGEKKVTNLLEQLERARHAPFERFLAALSIPEIGSATARLLAGHFESFEDLAAATPDELQHVEGIGPEMAESLRTWFDGTESRALLERLFAGGVELVYPAPDVAGEGPLAGKTVVFTGVLE